MPIDRPVVMQPKLFENYARHQQTLHPFLEFVRQMNRAFAANCFDESARFFVQPRIHGMGGNGVKIGSDRAHILRDRPLVIVQHDNEPFRLRFGVVKRFVTDPTGKRRVTRHHHDMFVVRAPQVAAYRHSQCGR